MAALVLGLPATPDVLAQTPVADQASDATAAATAAATEQLEALEYQLEAERVARQAAEKALAERSKLAQEQKVRIDQFEGTTSSLTKVMRELQAKASEAEKALTVAENAKAASERSAAERDTRIAELQNQLEDRDFQLQAQASAREAAEKSLAERTKRVQEQQIRIEQFEGAAGSLTKGMRELQAKVAELERQLGASENARTAAERTASDNARQASALQAKLEPLAPAAIEFGAQRQAVLAKVESALAGSENATLEAGRIMLVDDNLFETGSATLRPTVQAKVGDLAKLLREATAGLPEDGLWVVRVEGHTDAQKPGRNFAFRSNLELSAARAAAVASALVTAGFPSQHLACLLYTSRCV